MSDLAGAYDRAGPWRTVAWAVLLFGGGVAAAVGAVAATASLVAGFGLGKSGALRIGVVVGGALLLTAFLAPVAMATGADRSRVLAGVGAALGGAGLAWFWAVLPAGWTGNVGVLPAGPVGAYAVGLLAAFGAGFTAGPVAVEPKSTSGPREFDAGGVESVVASRDGGSGERGDADRSAAVGDGGEPDSDLSFFDDEGRS